MTSDGFRCADAAQARAEPLYGTASFVRRWLLLEQPGSWGRDALLESRLPNRLARELRKRARAAGTRIVLIRRGVRQASEGRHVYFARTDDCDTYLSHLTLGRVDDLLDIDLSPLGDGGGIEGAARRHEPLFLVCTHGRHDACCSIRGNQVSRIACATPGADAWECSHIGGDRFAANLVCFPHGVYYGRVEPDEVQMLMSAYANGTLSLAHYRGRCCYRFALQAAEYFARRASDTTAVDEVSLIEASYSDVERMRATFALGPDRRAEVEVGVSDSDENYRLTCRASRTYPIPRYELISCALGEGSV